jgi:hypothetical protein
MAASLQIIFSGTNTLLTLLLLMVFFGILEFGWSLAGANPPASGSQSL